MGQAVRLQAETLRSLAFGSIGAAYTAIGTATSLPAHLIQVQNLTDAVLLFSIDGVNDHFVLPASGFILLDITTNKTETQGFFLKQGTTFYVKESGTPTTGSVYVSVFTGNV